MTEKEWRQATTLWEAGEVTIEDLAKKFDRHPQSFIKYFKKNGIVKGAKSQKLRAKVAEKVNEEAANDAAIIAARIKETKEEHYKMASGLAKLTWAEVLKAKQDGVPIGAALNNLKALDTAMGVLKKAREERYAVLGLDRPDAIDENDVPELVIQELTAEQIAALRERNFNDVVEVEEELEGLEMPKDDEAGNGGVVEEA
jgi:phosphoribosyl-ATP pyrophosphohydrolase